MQNATLTIKNKESGEHRTFRIKICREGALAGKQIVEIMTGPDNEFNYQGFGFCGDCEIKVWKSKQSMKPYAVLIEHLLGIRRYTIADKYELQYSKNCARCNRTLTTPESIERGIGPECARLSR